MVSPLAAEKLHAQLDADRVETFYRGEHMKGKTTVRLLAVGAFVGASALLQGCAVVTGPYVAERAPVSSYSMVTRFDKRFLNADGTRRSSASSLRMPRERSNSPFYFRY
jgi:hypothetical protein